MDTPSIKYLGSLAHTKLCVNVTFSTFNVQPVRVGWSFAVRMCREPGQQEHFFKFPNPLETRSQNICVILSFCLSRLGLRQRPLWGSLWFRSIKPQVAWRGYVGVGCSLSFPMQEVATVKQSCRIHFQNKRRYFFMQQILDLWNSLPKGVIIAEVFAGIQGKIGQVFGREVHHWANYIRLKESPELKVVGGWRRTCRKDHVRLSCSCSFVGLSLWSVLQTDYCATWAPKIWNNNPVLNVFIWMVDKFCAGFLMCRWISLLIFRPPEKKKHYLSPSFILQQ